MVMFNYDEEFDILYLSIADKSRSYGDDKDNGLVISRDMETEEITGAMIYSFEDKLKQGKLPTLPSCFPEGLSQKVNNLIKDNCFKSTLIFD